LTFVLSLKEFSLEPVNQIEDADESLVKWSQLVFDAWRNLGEGHTGQDAIAN
jgi:hypothetical protein